MCELYKSKKKKERKDKKQTTGTACERAQMSHFIDKGFKSAIINMF